jgi:hypothetical protein
MMLNQVIFSRQNFFSIKILIGLNIKHRKDSKYISNFNFLKTIKFFDNMDWVFIFIYNS